MKIHIEDLKFQCIIGILDFEREKEQDVIINLEIDYDYSNDFIDYAKVSNLIEKIMKKDKFMLIEDALEKLFTSLKKNFSDINILYLKITKPSIMPNSMVSVSDRRIFNS